jgi:FKBP-type peptidyl-prolyl cis-trans isomerase 2
MDNVVGGNLVNVHFTLTIEGKIVDSSRGQEPLEFQVCCTR